MEPLPDLGTLSDDDLKRLIDELVREEDDVSFRRRMLQGRIDILRSGQGSGGREIDVESLARALAGRTAGDDTALPPEVREELSDLSQQEREISDRRRLLHAKIDMLRAELVARLQKSGGKSVLEHVDAQRLSEILAGKSAPRVDEGGS